MFRNDHFSNKNIKKTVTILIIGCICFLICIGKSIGRNTYLYEKEENSEDQLSPVGLEYKLKDGNIILKWNIPSESTDYYFTILQDGAESEAFWVSGTELSIPDTFEDGIITFRIAAPGTSGLSVDYVKKYNRQLLLLNPFGITSGNKIAFSWDADNLANLYHLEIVTLDGKTVKQLSISNKNTSVIVDDLQTGKYKWTVTPETQDGLQGIPSDWAYFEVTHGDLKVESVLGVEKDGIISMLNTPLTYPETAIIGPDGALYISDTHSNVIWRCEHGVSEIYIGTLLAGKSDHKFRRECDINLPTDIIFDEEGNLFFNDSGNKRICKMEKSTGIVSSVWEHGEVVKNFYIEKDGSFTILCFPQKIINSKNGEISYDGYTFLAPVAIVQNENRTIILDGGDSPQIVLFVDNKFQKSIPSVTWASALWMDEEKNIYVGEHTSICKLSWELEKKHFSGGYANVVYIAPDTEGNLLVTDTDAGGGI